MCQVPNWVCCKKDIFSDILAANPFGDWTMSDKYTPFFVRLRPKARQLLDKAAEIELKSRAELIDEAVLAHLENKYTDITSRLDQMLSQGSAK